MNTVDNEIETLKEEIRRLREEVARQKGNCCSTTEDILGRAKEAGGAIRDYVNGDKICEKVDSWTEEAKSTIREKPFQVFTFAFLLGSFLSLFLNRRR